MLHEADALRPHRLVGCGGDAGGGSSELLGECGPVRCSGRPQASVPHMGPIQGHDGATVRASYRSQRSVQVATGIEANQPGRRLRPAVPRVAVPTSWNDR